MEAACQVAGWSGVHDRRRGHRFGDRISRGGGERVEDRRVVSL